MTCGHCGAPQYRQQPNPLHSEMELRNMPAPGEEDMGGNPLQEGILGDWKGRGNRDEAFASVRTAQEVASLVDQVYYVALTAHNYLEARRQVTNDLNVFPVADGDTGDNMTKAVRGAVGSLAQLRNNPQAGVPEIVAAITTGIRQGGGNSGNLIGAIVSGAGEVFATGGTVQQALSAGAQKAWSAVRNPVPGTILSVASGAAEGAGATGDPSQDFAQAAQAAQQSLQSTPEQLDALKEYGVVDSGGYGLATLLAGIVAGLHHFHGSVGYAHAQNPPRPVAKVAYDPNWDSEQVQEIGPGEQKVHIHQRTPPLQRPQNYIYLPDEQGNLSIDRKIPALHEAPTRDRQAWQRYIDLLQQTRGNPDANAVAQLISQDPILDEQEKQNLLEDYQWSSSGEADEQGRERDLALYNYYKQPLMRAVQEGGEAAGREYVDSLKGVSDDLSSLLHRQLDEAGKADIKHLVGPSVSPYLQEKFPGAHDFLEVTDISLEETLNDLHRGDYRHQFREVPQGVNDLWDQIKTKAPQARQEFANYIVDWQAGPVSESHGLSPTVSPSASEDELLGHLLGVVQKWAGTEDVRTPEEADMAAQRAQQAFQGLDDIANNSLQQREQVIQTQQTARNPNVSWRPGQPGRGILVYDSHRRPYLHVWSGDTPAGEYLQQYAMNYQDNFVGSSYSPEFQVQPDGQIVLPEGFDDIQLDRLTEAVGKQAPDLGLVPPSEAQAAQQNEKAHSHALNWQPGNPGRGLIVHGPQGDYLHTWNKSDNPLEDLYHGQYIEEIGLNPANLGRDFSDGWEMDEQGNLTMFNEANWPQSKRDRLKQLLDETGTPIQVHDEGQADDLAAGFTFARLHDRMTPHSDMWSDGHTKQAIAPLLLGAGALGLGLAKQFAPKILQAVGAKGLIDGAMDAASGMPQMVAPPRPLEHFAYKTASLQGKRANDWHPSSDPNMHEDPHELRDGDHSNWGYDPSVNDMGGSEEGTGDPEELFTQVFPKLLHYYLSDESGADDPEIQQVAEAFGEAHDDLDPDRSKLNAILEELLSHLPNEPVTAAYPGAAPAGGAGVPNPGHVPQTPAQPASAPNMDTQQCPTCGTPLLPGQPCVNCAQRAQQQPGTQPNLLQPWTNAQPGQMQAKVAHQGPHNADQFAAVAELLTEQGREDEITYMLQHPEEYGEEMNEIRQRTNPPETEEVAPPEPVMEEAPPGATMPVPNMSPPGGGPPTGPPMMAKKQEISNRMEAALRNATPDSMAPRCPDCQSGTTGLMSDEGDFMCHACGNTWTKEIAADPHTSKFYFADKHPHSELHSEPSNFEGVPAADRDRPRDLEKEQDSSLSWKDASGEPLVVGREYEMHSANYDIPDIIRIEAVKPNAIEYTLMGEYGLERQTEIEREEADIERLEFIPTDEPEELGAEELDQPTGPDQRVDAGPGETDDLSRPHVTVSAARSWLLDGMEERAPATVPQEWERTAGKKYTPMEQREFVEERGVARNRDKLDLSNTHYTASDDSDEDLFW